MSPRPLNIALIGGGRGAFIAQPHQKAIHFDGTRRVTAAALFPDPKIALEEAANWPYPIQGYETYDALIAANATLPADQKLDYIVIVTPTNVHLDPALKALRAGIPVMCEKPMTLTLNEATQLVQTVRAQKIPFALAHTYLGHWTTRLARHIARAGLLGEIRWVDASYIQGWLATKVEATGNPQATWRTDPKRAGASGCGGDIGTHALMQLRYTTGLEVVELSANLETYVPGRLNDDHFTAYCRLNNGARALIRASQISIGHKNDFGIEINGTKGTLIWKQELPEQLIIHLPDQPDRIYHRGAVTPNDGFLTALPPALMSEPTIPSGHPEGFHDAYARLHRCFEADVRAYNNNTYTPAAPADGGKYATVEDGWTGMAFLETALKSSRANAAWTPMPAKI